MSTGLRVYESIISTGIPLSSSPIEVFVCSHDKDLDVGHYREMSYHWQCGLAQWAYGELAQQFKGRILSEEDMDTLRRALETGKRENEEVKVFDTSRMVDRMRALRRGVLKTPTVIVNGKKYEGLEEISHAISMEPKP